LKNFKDKNGSLINHYTDNLMKMQVERNGFIDFYEMGRTIEYKLPIVKGEKSLFVFCVPLKN